MLTIALLTLAFFSTIRYLVAFCVLLLMIFCIVDVLSSEMSRTAKTLWIVGLLLFPLVGSIVYLLVNKKN
jgi:hypothetical protein